MATNEEIVKILDTRTDADSPLTEGLVQDMVSLSRHGVSLVRSDGTGIMKGAFTADPTDAASSRAVDTAPTNGSIANVNVNMVMEVLTGTAAGNYSTVVEVGGSSGRMTQDTNLYSLGARSGDEYRIIYGEATDHAHTHDGVDSPTLGISPAGMIVPYAATTAPSGWLLCDGSAVSRTTYATLFALVSTTFGIGDGSTTFNVPDMRGRVAIALDNLGGGSADVITDTEADSLGGTEGDENTQSHSHDIEGNNDASQNTYVSFKSGTSSSSVSTAGYGAGASQNKQPYMALGYIIKT
ncbi:phage tail protein [bacterium]|nr:phage tail protein [bacterium]